ncbi:MFS monocarboxylate transporter-1 [Coleophoma crateriformis]|uniref:MFS monocarboxylate transporter-1 n=1 Tax=Coleophoma crateriformis TaxID=565419 RepID=A0A3D8RP50_9HELO|nr:MFS monocarboxylate transporter-1 [Coleophoma crateriformis]
MARNVPGSTSPLELRNLPSPAMLQPHSTATTPADSKGAHAHSAPAPPVDQLPMPYDLEPSTTIASRIHTFPEGGLRAWVVVFGSFCVIASTYGLISSAGLFQSYWQANQLSAYRSQDIGWITAVNVFLNLILGVQIGPLFDKYGPRYLLLVGAVFYVASLLLLGQCVKYWHFMLVYGILSGMSSALLTTSSLAVVAHWFEAKRGMASGIAFVGSSVGGIAFPLTLSPMLEKLSWAWAMRIIALVVAVLVVIGNLCIRGRLPPRKNGGAIDLKCFRDMRFTWATVGISWSPWLDTDVYHHARLQRADELQRHRDPQCVSLLVQDAQRLDELIPGSIRGSALGRSMSGWFSDRYGRFNTMILTLIWSLVAVFGLWMPVGNHVVLFYFFAPLFGFGSGSIISMAPVCIGQLCKADEYGQWYGTSYSLVSFATLLCIPIGGALLPVVGAAGFAAFWGGVLILSLFSFMMARWACQEYRWQWRAKI